MGISRVAIVGLGLMGGPLATLFLKAGYDVIGYDVITEQMSQLRPLGLKPSTTPGEAVRESDLIVLSLPNWNIVRDVVEGEGGILSGAHSGQIIIDTSTVPPWETRTMAEKLAKKGIEWMDAPISGSSAQARVGNIVFMLGGKKIVFDEIKPVLDRIAKKVVYVGEHGDAAMLKLIVNHTFFINQAAAIEGMVLGLKAGLRPDIMLDVLSSGAASSDLIKARGEDMLNGNYEPKGPVAIAVKDLTLSLETARRLGVVLPIGALYHQFIMKAHYNGWDQKDSTIVMKIYEQLAGIDN